MLETALNRQGLMQKKLRTEFYAGTGTQRLNLKARPVHQPFNTLVYLDEGGNFGAQSGSFGTGTQLVYGTDFCLDLDTDDGINSSGEQVSSSRSGTLIRINDLWPKRQVRQWGYLSPFLEKGWGNVKVAYTAGYTVDTMPAGLRAACDIMVAQFNYLFPLGVLLTSESYEERAMSILHRNRWWLMELVGPMILSYRNWTF